MSIFTDAFSNRSPIFSEWDIEYKVQQGEDEFYRSYAETMFPPGKDRRWQPLTRDGFEGRHSLKRSLLVQSPQQVIDKILYEHELFRPGAIPGSDECGLLSS